MSPKSAGLAVEWGYSNVSAYVDGMPVWKKRGHRSVPAFGFVEKGNVIIVDIRAPEKVAAGHIPGAYGFPAPEYEWAEFGLPRSWSAPIIICSDNTEEIEKAVKETRSWGYKKAVGFYGGLDLWQQKGRELSTGPAKVADIDNPIDWQRIYGPGQITIEEFKVALNTGDLAIIDVRSEVEYESGHFPGASNIPLDVLESRLDEIPAGQPVVAYCHTGARAEIAYDTLKKNGYPVRHLPAECECDETGVFEIW